MNITVEKLDFFSVDRKATENNNIFIEIWKDCWVELIERKSLAPEVPTINTARGIFFLFKADDIPLGVRAYYKITSEFYESYAAYVKPEYRGKSIGVLTRSMAIEELKKLGVKRLSIIALANAPETHKMYKDLGIEPSAYRYEHDI